MLLPCVPADVDSIPPLQWRAARTPLGTNNSLCCACCAVLLQAPLPLLLA